MPHVALPPENEIPSESKVVLDEFEKIYKRRSHIYSLMSYNPRLLKVAWEANKAIMLNAPNLKRWVREAILVITASTQRTPYCVQGHSHSLRLEGLSVD